MSQDPTRSPRRRPVDVLFGEQVELKPKQSAPETDTKQNPPGYMVEPPRPVTSLRPPPPEFPNDWHASAPPEPVKVIETPAPASAPADVVTPPPKPAMTALTAAEKIPEAVAFTPPADTSASAGRSSVNDSQRRTLPEPPALFVAPVPPPPPPMPSALPAVAPAPLYGQTELVELSQFVDQLYQNVADETSDSAALNAECLTNLNLARARIEKGEYAQAEAAAEQVKARLLRARASRLSTSAPATPLLFGGLILAALVGIILFAIPFALRIVPVIVPLLRGAGLGMLGGAAMALYQLSRHIAAREYDTAFNSKYALSPLFGALLGAILYLLSVLGILAAPNALGITIEPYSLMYLVAFLCGLENDVILETVRSWTKRFNRQTARPE